MSNEMHNKTALITGGAVGIGRATAMGFSQRGANVVVADVLERESQELVELIVNNGGQALVVKTDVSRSGDVKRLVKASVEKFGRIDYAFNNAGIEGVQRQTHEQEEGDWDRVVDINLKGVWLCMKYELREMLRQGGGSIVNMSSAAGLVGFNDISPYSASKHGVIGLTRSAALEYAKKNIRINAVCPGVIHTAMVERFVGNETKAVAALAALEPVGRLGTPEEVARAVVWLCSDEASFITGHPLAVDGGMVAA